MKSQRREQKSKRQHCQKGAGSTDYASLFYAHGADPAALSRFTLKNITKAPMFNPLQTGTIFPTGTSGIIPTGQYYSAAMPRKLSNVAGPMTPGMVQMGGKKSALYVTKEGKEISNPWIAHVYKFADKHKLSFQEAIKDKRVTSGYVKVKKAEK